MKNISDDKIEKLLEGMNVPDDEPERKPISSMEQASEMMKAKFSEAVNTEKVGVEEDSQVEVARMPARPEWIAMLDDMNSVADEATVVFDQMLPLMKKLARKHTKVWSTISDDADDDRNMRYDPETKEIIILEEK